jgi:hypothetical protein
MSVLQSSFLYAWLEYVLFIIKDYIYVIIFKPSFFWIKIMCKLPSFLTIQKPNFRQFSITGFAAV